MTYGEKSGLTAAQVPMGLVNVPVKKGPNHTDQSVSEQKSEEEQDEAVERSANRSQQ